MTHVRLAYGGPERALVEALRGGPGLRQPALLVSFAYWKQFAKCRPTHAFRDYSLDSGAFTVKNSGGTINLGLYIEFCRQQLATDPQCAEVFALDVIGDWRESQRNTERMWKAGVPAIPVYHYGAPESALKSMARQYPKIAVGGLAGAGVSAPVKLRWVQEVFARIWPHRVHGLGMCGEPLLMAVPFDSVDASSWEQAPAAFGTYRSMAKPVRAPRGKQISLRTEVEWYLDLEERVTARWRRELQKVRQ